MDSMALLQSSVVRDAAAAGGAGDAICDDATKCSAAAAYFA